MLASSSALLLPFASLLAFGSPLVLGIVLTQTQAIIATIVLLLVIIIAWKFLKLAFRIALIIVVAIAIWFVLRWAGIL